MRWALPLLALAACSDGKAPAAGSAPDLEQAAIARGLVRDPADRGIDGLYARDTDRLCIVPAKDGHRIGVFVDYGDGITCSGAGTVRVRGETMHVELGDDGQCRFDAAFDGDTVRFPGALPDGCGRYCTRRASYAGLEVTRLSASVSEAAAMRDAAGRRLCPEAAY